MLAGWWRRAGGLRSAGPRREQAVRPAAATGLLGAGAGVGLKRVGVRV
jgi:hypothetical protein